jgi:protein TonB
MRVFFVDLAPPLARGSPGGVTAVPETPRAEPPPPPATPATPEAVVAAVPHAARPPRRRPPPAPATPRVPDTLPSTPSAATPAGVADGVDGGSARGLPGGVPGTAGTEPVPISAAHLPPVLVERVLPDYPPEARRREIEGLVVVEAIVGRDGRVEPDSVRVQRSRPPFDEAAVAAVRRWRFRPGRDARGEPLRVALEVPIRFALR